MDGKQFLDEMADRMTACETAVHNGDVTERVAMWSHTQPLSLFGAWKSGQSWDDIRAVFDLLGKSFSDCTSYRNEVIAAEACADLAYTVAYEHTSTSVDGVPRSYVLRATTIFRREDGGWRVVHRHGSPVPDDRMPG